MLQLQYALVFQLAIRADHSVGVHHEVLGYLADRRQLVALPQRAHLNGVLHLLHQLEIKGHAGRGMDAKDHKSVLMNGYTRHLQIDCQERN
jgi:hypothetical protein